MCVLGYVQITLPTLPKFICNYAGNKLEPVRIGSMSGIDT